MSDRSQSSLLPHCRRCGEACCRYSSPIIDQDERDHIVAATGKDYFLEVETPQGSYFIIGRKADGTLRNTMPTEGENGDPCTFLSSDGTCSIQSIKPLDCAAYPVRAVPLAEEEFSWHLHRSCPAHDQLSDAFVSAAIKRAEHSARRFNPAVFLDWLKRYSQWTLAPEAAWVQLATPKRSYEMPKRLHRDSDANRFMGSAVRHLGRTSPEYCDRSGRGFWPVPAMFPRLLSHCLDRLQVEVTRSFLSGCADRGRLLARCRAKLLRLVTEGDLGEDHTALYLADHPDVKGIKEGERRRLPFHRFCQGVLAVDDPAVVLGALMRNEAGSIGEMEALLDVGIVAPGPYAEVHLVEEVVHAQLAEEIGQLVQSEPAWRGRFEEGQRLHDDLYLASVEARSDGVSL